MNVSLTSSTIKILHAGVLIAWLGFALILIFRSVTFSYRTLNELTGRQRLIVSHPSVSQCQQDFSSLDRLSQYYCHYAQLTQLCP